MVGEENVQIHKYAYVQIFCIANFLLIRYSVIS